MFESLENQVLHILQTNRDARADDMTLYAHYIAIKAPYEYMETVFIDRDFRVKKMIAPYSTISRIRRKLQEKYPELKPSPEMIAKRKKREAVYRAYAKSNK